MIELKIEGVCKECPFRELTLNNYDETVKCKHVVVCKFICDPHGKEALKAACEVAQEEEFKIVTWDDMERENNA